MFLIICSNYFHSEIFIFQEHKAYDYPYFKINNVISLINKRISREDNAILILHIVAKIGCENIRNPDLPLPLVLPTDLKGGQCP